jgi:hypothetical protein
MAVGSPLTVLVLALLIAALVLAAVGIVHLIGRRTRTGLWLLAAGVLIAVLPFAAVAAWDRWDKQHTVWVEGLDPANDSWFEVDIAHRRTFQDGTTYNFHDAGSVEHVVDVFQEQHPDGVPTIPSTLPTDTDVSLWHISLDDIRYDLLGGQETGGFALEAQVAVVVPSSPSADKVRIPYPASALGGDAEFEGVQSANRWTSAQWHEWYADISEVTFGDNTITVPTNLGGTVTLTFDDAGEFYTVASDH